MKKKHNLKITVRVTPQTAYNLDKLIQIGGLKKIPEELLTSLFEKNASTSREQINHV